MTTWQDERVRESEDTVFSYLESEKLLARVQNRITYQTREKTQCIVI